MMNEKEKKFREFYKSATDQDLTRHVGKALEAKAPLVLKMPPRGPLQRRGFLGVTGERAVVSPFFKNHDDEGSLSLVDRMQGILKVLKQRAADPNLVLSQTPAHSDPNIADTIATLRVMEVTSDN